MKKNKKYSDPFKTLMESQKNEKKRIQLANAGKLKELKELYDPSIIHLPEMNSPEFWDFHSKRSFDRSPDRSTKNRIKFTVNEIEPNSQVLEYGIGYGYIINECIKMNKKLKYTGIDWSEEFISQLQTKYPNYHFSTNISKVSKNSFDYILILEVLEHITPPKILEFLKMIKEYLKPGGKIIVSVPIGFNYINNETFICWSCGNLLNSNGHVRSYSPELVSAELKLAGFNINNIIPLRKSLSKVGYIKYYIQKMFRVRKRKVQNVIVVAKKVS